MGQILCALMLLWSSALTTVNNQTAWAQMSPKEALLVGDSVMASMRYNNPAWNLLSSTHPFIFKAEPCQRLISTGCTKSARKSSLTYIKDNFGKFSKVIVVATGYNDFDDISFARALAEIAAEAKRQGVSVLWLTYREQGIVRKKAVSYNDQLRKFSLIHQNVHLLDWNEISYGRDTWFAKDKVHMSRAGEFEMAKAISTALNNIIPNNLRAQT